MAAKYAAVSVRMGSACCRAVRELEGRVFLIGEVPLLPLKGCSEPGQCRCRYTKHDDRRFGDEDRRHFDTVQRALMFSGSDKRRNRRGRRTDD